MEVSGYPQDLSYYEIQSLLAIVFIDMLCQITYG